jgi:hypothetical protein
MRHIGAFPTTKDSVTFGARESTGCTAYAENVLLFRASLKSQYDFAHALAAIAGVIGGTVLQRKSACLDACKYFGKFAPGRVSSEKRNSRTVV